MTRFIIIQETGSDQLLVVDKHTRTVQEVDASMLDDFDEEGTGISLDAARRGGQPLTRGIATAIAGKSRLELSGRYFYAAGAPA